MNVLLILAASLWISLSSVTFCAEDAGSNEPIEFASKSPVTPGRPKKAAPRKSANPWGFAVFSPDSKMVATVLQPDENESKGVIVVWDVPAAKVRCQFKRSTRILAVERHAHRPTHVRQRAQFIAKRVARATGTVAAVVSRLPHEVRHHAMHTHAVEVALARQRDEALRGERCLDDDLAVFSAALGDGAPIAGAGAATGASCSRAATAPTAISSPAGQTTSR